MYDSDFQILFLGEDLAWSKVSHSLADAPRVSLKIHRAQSLNELFLILAGGTWHAVLIDVHAWNFQGLHYIDKVRSEYPVFPILALYSTSMLDLAAKARNVGASRCLSLEQFSADALHAAVVFSLSEQKPQSHLRKASPVQLNFNLPDTSSLPSSNAQIISHALNNLLCVITANADILAEHLNGSAPGNHSLAEIKKAAKSAADLMRQLK
jgi:DNA-binding NarL/FixJ family response regulator